MINSNQLRDTWGYMSLQNIQTKITIINIWLYGLEKNNFTVLKSVTIKEGNLTNNLAMFYYVETILS